MKTYTIKTPYYNTTRSRRDHAVHIFRKAVYEALRADGQLDTEAGWNVYNACELMALDVRSGAYDYFSFSHPLPHKAGLISFECNPR